MKKTMLQIAVAAALTVPFAAQATIYTFNAALSGANERPAPIVTSATGIAILAYDDKGTTAGVNSLLDDTFSVAVAAFDLSGPAVGYHIHAAATINETAPVRINFENDPPFLATVDGNNVTISGKTGVISVAPGLANGMIPATAASATNAGHVAMSFLQALQSQLAYVNIHTAANPTGEIRGQLFQVAAVPEPETYALMLAGLGLVGWVAGRRRKVGV